MGYEQLQADLRGVAFTNPTPFSEDGERVRHGALAENIEHLADAGARTLIPNGNTGEYYSLTDEERVACAETAVESFGDGSVVAGVGGSTKTARSLIDAYENAGVDAVMVMHPVHTYVHERGLLEYYERLAEATDLGVVLYKRGPELTHRVIAELAAYENVVAVKYADNDVKGFSSAVASVSGDLVWSNGIAERFAPAFAVEGAEGYTTGIGNFVPETTLALMDALRDGDWERARELRELLRPYEDFREEPGADSTIAAANNVPAVKYGMELAGLHGGPVREPLVDLSDADAERAREYYERIRQAEF